MAFQNLIACRPASYGKFHNEAFKHLAEIGITHVELDVPQTDRWESLEAELSKCGLKVSSVGGSITLTDPNALQEIDHLARGARFFGSKIIFLSVKSGGKALSECYSLLRAFGDVAATFGATIALETHPDLITNGEVATATMLGTAHTNVALNYDSANLYFYNQEIDGIVELKKFLPWLGAVHLKETNGKYKTWYFPGLHEGDGIVNFPEIFRICNNAGFFGPFTMELEGIDGEEVTREQAFARVANSLQYLKSIKVV